MFRLLLVSLCSLFIVFDLQAQTLKEQVRADIEAFRQEIRDEIEFEKVKSRSYAEAYKLSKESKKQLVVYIGCGDSDLSLFNSLKGQVILCYLPSRNDPFPETKEGVIIGSWAVDGSLVRANLAAASVSKSTLKALSAPPPAKVIEFNFQPMISNCPDGKCPLTLPRR